MFTSVLFDKDGCLLDFDKTWGIWARDFLDEISEGDVELAGDLARHVGYDRAAGTFLPSSPIIAGTPEDGVRLVLPLLPKWDFDALLAYSNDTAASVGLHPVVPLKPLLARLKQMGLILGVATNDAEATAKTHMQALQVETDFDLILGSDSGYGGKPGTGMQTAFLDAFDLEAEQGIMVGDSLHDMHSGRAAGMICVAVLTGPADRTILEPAADVVLPDIGDLPAWLEDQRG